MFPFCIGTGVGSAGARPAFSAGGSAPFSRLSRLSRGAVLLKAQITLLGGVGILLIPGSILLPHLPTHLSGQKCAMPQKNDNCI
ncbi:MAG: hypothetical protein EGQ29_08330 [Clostridiales bacterium]|nr:hypothetical protein [Clostridiales bacterium]